MKTKRLTLTVIFTVSIFFSSVCHAELGGMAPMPEIELKKSAGPSLDETLQWIKKKFASIATSQDLYHTYRYDVFFDGCEVNLVSEEGVPDGRRKARLDFHSFSLPEIDHINITKVYAAEEIYLFELHSIGNRSVFHERKLGLNDISDDEFYRHTLEDKNFINQRFAVLKNFHTDFSWLDIWLPDMEVAQSMANAFKHAAELCQEKVAKERATKSVKPKDLF